MSGSKQGHESLRLFGFGNRVLVMDRGWVGILMTFWIIMQEGAGFRIAEDCGRVGIRKEMPV